MWKSFFSVCLDAQDKLQPSPVKKKKDFWGFKYRESLKWSKVQGLVNVIVPTWIHDMNREQILGALALESLV